jgi:hypothetical protein
MVDVSVLIHTFLCDAGTTEKVEAPQQSLVTQCYFLPVGVKRFAAKLNDTEATQIEKAYHFVQLGIPFGQIPSMQGLLHLLNLFQEQPNRRRVLSWLKPSQFPHTSVDKGQNVSQFLRPGFQLNIHVLSPQKSRIRHALPPISQSREFV